jgi:hypothetical protein
MSSSGRVLCDTVLDYQSSNSDIVRISEWLEVEFTPLENTDIVQAQVACIDEQIEKIKESFGKEISQLQAKKQELLALGG